MHLATGAVVNAVWDLLAKEAGKPVWRLVAEMTPGRDRQDRRLPLPHRRADAATRRLTFCARPSPARPSASPTLEREGYPCYTTSAGWLGYSDDKLRRLCQEAVDAGFNHIKMKVGRDLDDDIRRLDDRPRGDRPRPLS